MVTFDALRTVRANLGWLVKAKNAHYIAIVKRNLPLLHAQVSALPWRQVPGGAATIHPRLKPSASTASIRTETDNRGTPRPCKLHATKNSYGEAA